MQELRSIPNPSNSIFNISIDSDLREKYIITDAIGRTIKTGTSSKRFTVDMSDQTSGIYLLSIPGVVSSRLVIN